MPARPIGGKEPARLILESLKPQVKELDPKLVIVQVSGDSASDVYVRKKLEACASIGMRSEHALLSATATLQEVLQLIDRLNADPDVTGIIIQLPLPENLWDARDAIFSRLKPEKDVDGFSPANRGALLDVREAEKAFAPATPSGVLVLLDHYNIDVAGQHVVIVGRSNIVGRPLALLLLHLDATVTICHSKTTDLAKHTRSADILISAVGKPHLITPDMVKRGAVVIDVGITRADTGLVGDVDFVGVSRIASAITPVPGGVGPLTVACLLANCVRAKRQQL